MAAFVPSLLPSSTRMSSPAKPPISNTPITRRVNSSTLYSSLKQGTTTDSSMDIGAENISETRQEADQHHERRSRHRHGDAAQAGGHLGGRAAVEGDGEIDGQELLVDAEGVVQHAEAVAAVVVDVP